MASLLDRVKKRSREDDYYVILGCDQTSTSEQITSEYRVRAKRYHPDRAAQTENEQQQAAEEFVKLNKAHEVLLDAEMRSKYDQFIGSGLQISFEDWLGLEKRLHSSMHWGGERKGKPALSDSTRKDEQTHKHATNDDSKPDSNLEDFRKGAVKNSVLDQFRSYKL